MIKFAVVLMLVASLLSGCISVGVDQSKLFEGNVINVVSWRTLDGTKYVTMTIEFRDDQDVLQQAPASFPWNDPIAVRYGHEGATVCLYPSFGYHHLKIVPCS
jgi:hypothetical protein